MARVLIIGYGNRLRGDDGLGWHAAERLRELAPDRGVQIVAAHQLAPEMAEEVSGAELVLFLDSREGGTPGQFRQEEVQPAARDRGAVSHHLAPSELLDLALRVYGKCPQAMLLSLSGAQFEHGDGLSGPVQAALPGYLAAILEAVGRACSGSQGNR